MDAMKVQGVTRTSSPAPTPTECRAVCNACVHEPVARQCLAPINSANRFSNVPTCPAPCRPSPSLRPQLPERNAETSDPSISAVTGGHVGKGSVLTGLPPSAASIVHPHVQVLVDRRPTAYQQRLLEASRDYLDQTGESFWRELVREERRLSERFIGENSSVSVLASYAPQGNREVLIIFKEASSLADLDSGHLTDFAEAVVKLLGGYHQIGVNSFNLSTFSAPCGEKLDHYSLHAKLISRPVFQPWYRNDTGFLERLHYEADIEMEPEQVAASLRACFLA